MTSGSIIHWVPRIGAAFNAVATLGLPFPDSFGAFALVFFAWLGYSR